MKIYIHPFPGYSKRNKYFDLIYSGLDVTDHKADEFEVDGQPLPKLLFKTRQGKHVLHIHWATELFGSKYIVKSLFYLARNYWLIWALKKIKKFKVVWTMHNAFAHDYPHPHLDKIGRKMLFHLSDTIIVHHSRFQRRLEKKYPDKTIRYIPHPDYRGAYGDIRSDKQNCKNALGFQKDDIILLALGMIRPYKKLGNIIKVMNKIKDTRPDIKLLIAGMGKDEHIAYLHELANNNPDIYIENRFVENSEISKYLGAADFSVFYYDDSVLSSGGIILSLSYGVPVISREFIGLDVVSPGKNGYLFHDDAELRSILLNLTISDIGKTEIKLHNKYCRPEEIKSDLQNIYIKI